MYPPISLVGLSVSLPQLDTPKCLNVLTLIATLETGISLFIELTEGCSIHAIVTGFNKTLDMNLEHTGRKYTSVQSIKHHRSFRKEEKYKKNCLLH